MLGGAGGTSNKKDPQKRRSMRHSRPLSPPEGGGAGGGDSSTSSYHQSQQQQQEHHYHQQQQQHHKVSSNKWQCYACTFSNKQKVDVCEMCGKSRNSPDLRQHASMTPEMMQQQSGSNHQSEEGREKVSNIFPFFVSVLFICIFSPFLRNRLCQMHTRERPHPPCM